MMENVLFGTIFLSWSLQTIAGQLLIAKDFPQWHPHINSRDYLGDPLVLTKIIESGNVAEARELARVNESEFLDVVSYSGFLTVNDAYDSNLYFWFFPAEGSEQSNDNEYGGSDESNDRPVVLWLQGGPGSSSMFGLFTENGPFFVNDDNVTIRKNPYSWHKKYNLLFIDNPVGTGFSYTDPEGFCTNIPQTADHLYIALKQFFKLFPLLQTNEFFIAGESFAGKYIPAVGNAIWEGNKVDDSVINLQGLALGNAFTDPMNMLEYAEIAYQMGLIDIHGKNQMKIYEMKIKEVFPDIEAHAHWENLLRAFLQYSNYKNWYNMLQPDATDLRSYVQYLEQNHIRRALHLGGKSFDAINGQVYYKLAGDFLTSAMHWTEKLLNEGLRIMYYNGNLDLIVAYPLSENAYQHMKWNGSEKYLSTRRNPLFVNSKLAGYVKVTDNFVDTVVINAGHMVPTDQPEVAFELIDRFIRNDLQ